MRRGERGVLRILFSGSRCGDEHSSHHIGENVMDDAPLFYLTDPRASHQSSEDEVRLGTVKPSVWLAVPKIALHVILALAATYASAMLYNQIAWIAQMAAQVVGDAFPYNTWYGWYLAIVWVVVMFPAVWRLLALRSTRFDFTSQRIYYFRGIFNRRSDQLEIVRIRDLSVESPLWMRPFNLGNITLDTVDRSHPELRLEGQKEAERFKDWLHRLNAMEKARTGYREFESTQ